MSAPAHPAGMEPNVWTSPMATSAAVQRVRAGQCQAGKSLKAGLLEERANHSLRENVGVGCSKSGATAARQPGGGANGGLKLR